MDFINRSIDQLKTIIHYLIKIAKFTHLCIYAYGCDGAQSLVDVGAWYTLVQRIRSNMQITNHGICDTSKGSLYIHNKSHLPGTDGVALRVGRR